MTRLEAIAADHARKAEPTDANVTIRTDHLEIYREMLEFARKRGGERRNARWQPVNVA